jgi:glutaminyl-peptide cyclotransferase
MSDGSHVITVRDPETFAPVRTMNVTLYGAYVDEINELECVDGNIWANVWQTDSILRIDAQTGIVTGVVDGRALLSPEERAALESGAVLNGIAYNPETETFLVTGKRWPALFEVEFVPAG